MTTTHRQGEQENLRYYFVRVHTVSSREGWRVSSARTNYGAPYVFSQVPASHKAL